MFKEVNGSRLGVFFVNSEHITPYFIVSILDFEHLFVC